MNFGIIEHMVLTRTQATLRFGMLRERSMSEMGAISQYMSVMGAISQVMCKLIFQAGISDHNVA